MRTILQSIRLPLVASLALLAACDGTPAPPVHPSPAMLPATSQPPRFTLSGLVFDGSLGFPQPVSSGSVHFKIDGGATGRAVIDASGRYSIPNLPAGNVARVTAWFDTNTTGLQQPCPVSTTIEGDTNLDIEVVPYGTTLTRGAWPSLSGTVHAMTADGRQPRAREQVFYYVSYQGTWDAYTETDDNGRYEFCRIPPGDGVIATGWCDRNETMQHMPVAVRGDTVFDVDLSDFYASCRMLGSSN